MTGFAVSETQGERCSDCQQVPNLTAFQNKPQLIKAGRTSERNSAATFHKHVLQPHVQKPGLLSASTSLEADREGSGR